MYYIDWKLSVNFLKKYIAWKTIWWWNNIYILFDILSFLFFFFFISFIYLYLISKAYISKIFLYYKKYIKKNWYIWIIRVFSCAVDLSQDNSKCYYINQNMISNAINVSSIKINNDQVNRNTFVEIFFDTHHRFSNKKGKVRFSFPSWLFRE